MLKKILIGITVGLVALVVLVAVQPGHFSYSRSRTMSAPQSAVFAQVNDFHKWDAWSPWAKLDPNCKNTFSGADSGKGAVFAWAGNSEVGEGKMTIVESRPHDLIRLDLEFIKPMEGKSLTEFTFKSEGEGKTVVTWTMSGENNFVGKAMSLVMDCEKMIGGQFEKGLESMEKSARAKDDARVSKEGTVTLKTFPGLPNYESVEQGDAPETYLVLVSNDGAAKAEEFQLFFEGEPSLLHKSVSGMVGRKVLIMGQFWPAITGHHHTETMLTVDDVRAL